MISIFSAKFVSPVVVIVAFLFDRNITEVDSSIFICKENSKLRIIFECIPTLVVFGQLVFNTIYAWNVKRRLDLKITPSSNPKPKKHRRTSLPASDPSVPIELQIRRNSADPYKFKKIFVVSENDIEVIQCSPLHTETYNILKKTLKANIVAFIVVVWMIPVSTLRYIL